MRNTENVFYKTRAGCARAARNQLGWNAEPGVHFRLVPTRTFEGHTRWRWHRLEPKGQSTVPCDFDLKRWPDDEQIARRAELDSFGDTRIERERSAYREYDAVIKAHDTVEALVRMVQTAEPLEIRNPQGDLIGTTTVRLSRRERLQAVIERLDDLAHDNEALAITLKELADELHVLLDTLPPD